MRLGIYYQLCGEYDSAMASFEKILALPSINEDPYTLIEVYRRKAQVFFSLHRYREALECMNAVLLKQMTHARRPLPVTTLKNDYNNMGKIQERSGNYDEAKETYQKVVELFKRRGHTESLDLAKAIAKVGEAERLIGNLDQALEYTENALRIYRKNIGEFPWQPTVARLHESLGDLRLETNDSSTRLAIENYEIAVEVYHRAGKSESDKPITKLLKKISDLR